MKMPLRLMLLAALAMVSALPSHGQCAQLQTTLLTCGGPNNCQQSVPVNLPVSSEYGTSVGYFTVYCCESTFETYTEGGGCTIEGERIPQPRLEAAAELEPILVRNCSGLYEPYLPSSGGGFDVARALSSSAKITLN
jgi:hypothetical protein